MKICCVALGVASVILKKLTRKQHIYFPRFRGIPLNIEPHATTPSGETQHDWLTPEIVAWLKSLYNKRNETIKTSPSAPLSDIPRMR